MRLKMLHRVLATLMDTAFSQSMQAILMDIACSVTHVTCQLLRAGATPSVQCRFQKQYTNPEIKGLGL